jgi:hypothetical protein
MGSAYTITANQATLNAANLQGLLIIRGAALFDRASMLRIVHMSITHDGVVSSVVVAQWGVVTSPGGYVNDVTPAPVVVGTVDSGITSDIALTAPGTCAALTDSGGQALSIQMGSQGFINRTGWEWLPTQGEHITLIGDQYFALCVDPKSSGLTLWSATLTYEEVN